MKNKLLIPALYISAIAMLSACQHSGTSDSAMSNADTVKTAQSADMPNDSAATILLPSPLQIGSIFKNAGLTYMPGLTNEKKETAQYTSTYSQALNMGIYGADMSYCVLNKQTQEALDYLKTLHSLADKLGFGSVFESNSMTKRFQDNLGSEDSLTDIIADLQMDADTYLASNNQKYVSTVSFAGAWVESMYIGSKVYAQKKNENVSQRISEQMNILENLIKSLNKYKTQDNHITEIVASLMSIENSYMNYDEVKNANKDSNELVKLSDAHIDELSQQIQQLREKFIMS